MERAQIAVLDGSTFMVSDGAGEVTPSADGTLGLFFRDMRHLSTWQLTLDGRRLDPLSASLPSYDHAEFFLVLGTGTIYENPTVNLIRHRWVGDGLHEELRVQNSGLRAVGLDLRLDCDADFADLFEVKDRLPKQGELYRRVDDDVLVLGYRRADFGRETRVTATSPAWIDEHGMSFRLDLGPGESWSVEVDAAVTADRRQRPGKRRDTEGLRRPQPNMDADLDGWVASSPALTSERDDLRHVYHRSLCDLAALRFYPDSEDGSASLPAAGLPWFMGLFGRDSLLASYQALPFQPELAATTLRALAAMQATARDDFRDATPGKILHELRFGELTHFRERPQSPYYGSADSTPLFLILLDEYERWSGDTALVRELEPAARAALSWLDDGGDPDGDGYLEYRTRNPDTGLVNQCWKDSGNSIVHPDGRLATLPRATCELQGYAYDARLRGARLARAVWADAGLADRLESRAADLKKRFNADFWIPAGGFFALALDGGKEPVRTLTSNIGHLLWSGIVDADRAGAVVDHLMGDALFSGWGVRTLAAGQPVFNPVSYHNGTVWPHDNSIVAAGLARYGYHAEAGRVAVAVLQAAVSFDHRLPEVFAGFDRALTGSPVEYPTACSPQAWAAGAPMLFLRTLLGLEPDGERLTADPHLPAGFGAVELRGIPGRWGRADVLATAEA